MINHVGTLVCPIASLLDENEIHGQYHPGLEYLYGGGATMLDKMKANEHKRWQEHVIYYPSKDKVKWEPNKSLAKNLIQIAINEFLTLS